MLNTLGDVVTCALVVAALAIVPYKLARVWLAPQLRRLAGMFLMSRPEKVAPHAADMDAVYIPVSHTGMNAHTTAEARDITGDYEMPRIGRRLSDDEIIALLATQKGVDGAKYRFSANEIALLMKGDRNTRLDQIRAVREGPPAPQVREHQARLEQLQSK